MYRNFEKSGLAITYELNQKRLSQMSSYFNYMNDIVKNFCINQYSEPDNQQLMFNNNVDLFDIQRIINKLQKTISSNSMFHSLIIYNSTLKQYYSTYGSGALTTDDEELNSLIEKHNEISQLNPIPRILSKDTYYYSPRVFTYIFCDFNEKDGNVDGALIVNVKTDWLFENMKTSNNEDSNLIIIDKKGKVIADQANKLKIYENISNDYLRSIEIGNNSGKSSVTTINGKKRVITYLAIPNTEWLLINDEPYETIYRHVNQIRIQTIALTVIFLILAIIISLIISKVIYTPFNKLIKQVIGSLKKDSLVNAGLRDDTEYLSKAFEYSMATMEDFEEYKKSTQDIAEENILKGMLLGSKPIEHNILQENLTEYRYIKNTDCKIRIILFRIDYFHKKSKSSEKSILTIEHNMPLVISNIISIWSNNKVLNMGNGELVVILDLGDNEGYDYENIKEKIKDTQVVVRNETGITVSAYISDLLEDICQIERYYREAQNLFRYKIYFGNSCIIDKKYIFSYLGNKDFNYPESIENKIIEDINSGNIDKVVCEYKNLVNIISTTDIDNFIMSLIHLLLSVNREINKINLNRIDGINMNLKEFYNELIELETIEEINNKFIELFMSINQQQKKVKENKYNVTVNSMLDYINQEYRMQNLSLKDIAKEFKISPVYLGKIFKEVTKKSIAESINDVRLKKAVHYLKNTNHSIKDIMEAVGYNNESNFYKLYKKNFGLTPKEYRLNVILQGKVNDMIK
jgi:two-component system, response regulator YesN